MRYPLPAAADSCTLYTTCPAKAMPRPGPAPARRRREPRFIESFPPLVCPVRKDFTIFPPAAPGTRSGSAPAPDAPGRTAGRPGSPPPHKKPTRGESRLGFPLGPVFPAGAFLCPPRGGPPPGPAALLSPPPGCPAAPGCRRGRRPGRCPAHTPARHRAGFRPGGSTARPPRWGGGPAGPGRPAGGAAP